MSQICKFTVTASRDIESIIDYVADESSFDAAERLLANINNKCRILARFPSMGRKRYELAPSLRSFPIDIATAKAVRTLGIKRAPSHLVNNQTGLGVCEFGFSTKTSTSQSCLGLANREASTALHTQLAQ